MESGAFDTSALQKVCPEGYVKICEGSTAVLFPPAMLKGSREVPQDEEAQGPSGGEEDNQAVFYNPAQVVNRDLSVCAIELFSRLRVNEPPRKGGSKSGIRILEALSATGLRAIRYFKEISRVQYVIANDMDPDAVDCIRHNCAFNGVPVGKPTATSNFDLSESLTDATDGDAAVKGAVIPNLGDAVDVMHLLALNPGPLHGKRFTLTSNGQEQEPVIQQELMDVVDLDPYGSASPFLEGAFRCIKEGGLMLVTSTDSAVLCGNYIDTCHAKYNSLPYKGSHCHEMAVRLLLACAERVANKHKKYIVPLVSLHIDFYIRCFFRVYTQPAETKLSACKLGYQMQCANCPAHWVRPMTVPRPQRPPRGRKRDRKSNAKSAEQAPAAPPALEEAEEEQQQQPSGPRTEQFPACPLRSTNPRVTVSTLKQLLCGSSSSECPVCGREVTVSGPLYCGPTQNREFLAQLLTVIDEKAAQGRLTAVARIKGLVCAASDELPDCPLFYNLPDIASYVKVRCPQTPCFVAALGRLGYHCSQVHCEPSGFKTDCPPDVLFSVMLQWKALQDKEDETKGVPLSGSKADVPLRIQPFVDADFTYSREYDFRRDATGVPKFIQNAPAWGPKRRHTGAAAPP